MPVTGKYPGALRAVLTRASRNLLERDAALVAARARVLAPKDTGLLASRISYSVKGTTPETMEAIVIADVPYATAVEKGTGIYGPTGRPIRPKRAKVMVFPGRRGIVYAKTVLGQKPQPFLGPALRSFRK